MLGKTFNLREKTRQTFRDSLRYYVKTSCQHLRSESMQKTHQKYAMFDFAIISLVFYRKYVNINDFFMFCSKNCP